MGKACLTPSRVPAPITRQGLSDPRIDLTRGLGGTAAVTSTVGSSLALIIRSLPTRRAQTRSDHPIARAACHASRYGAAIPLRPRCMSPLWREGAPASPNETDQPVRCPGRSFPTAFDSVWGPGVLLSLKLVNLKKKTKQTRHSNTTQKG